MENVKAAKEKRKSERFLMYLPLEYQVTNPSGLRKGTVVDASEGGLLIHAIDDIPVNARLNLEVLFPKGFELNNFEAQTEIVWKDRHPSDNSDGYRYGLKFVELPEDDQRKLRQLLSGRLQKTKDKVKPSSIKFEMRRHPRFPVDLPLEYWNVNSPIGHRGQAINASEGGLMVFLSQKVETGQHLKMILLIGSDSNSETIEILVQAVWIEIGLSMATEDYRAGVKIIGMTAKNQSKWSDLVGSLAA
jgi:c-di-GMP-binding flagellar brake protein YcgR